MQQRDENKPELKMIKMSDVQPQTVDWLWYPFIPYGKLTIIQGDPGDGKTTLVLNIAAKLSKGEGLDSDMKITEPVNIIYQTAEDGLADRELYSKYKMAPTEEEREKSRQEYLDRKGIPESFRW